MLSSALWTNELTSFKSLFLTLSSQLINRVTFDSRKRSKLRRNTVVNLVAGIYTKIELGKLQNWFNGEQRDLTRNYSDWTKLMAWNLSRELPTSKYRLTLDSSLRLKRESTNAGHPYTYCSAKTMCLSRYCWLVCYCRFNIYLMDI